MTAALLAVSSGFAQATPENVLVYQSSYFADQRPNTAWDMISRLPGFVFDDGDTARGFAGTAGNVLIDGQRPTSKTDDLQSILIRLPAADVERIEVIRGGEEGIDMQGKTVVANIIRKKGDSTQVVVEADDNFWLGDHHSVPSATIQFTQHSGDSTFEGSIARLGNYDDSVGKGSWTLTDPATGVVQNGRAKDSGRGAGAEVTGAATVPLFGGQFKANIELQNAPFFSSLKLLIPGNDQYIHDKSGDSNAELGLHWIGNIGTAQLETLVLQRLEHDTDVNTSDQLGLDQIFLAHNNVGETIARATLTYPFSPDLTLEGGGEAVFNFLDGKSTFYQNGTLIPVPSANAYVDEKRGELFAQGTWKISPDWMLEAGARFEFSTIAELGDTDQTRSFFYPKPRVVLTWNADKDTQLRARYERVLGQLNFSNFVASSNLSASGINAGNPNLMPDQHDQYELSFERHFWSKGALVVTGMHEEIKDVVDYVPIYSPAGDYDAPGNIGNGRNNQIDVELTLPLDKIGLENGLLKATDIFRKTEVRDPVTGQERGISQYPQYRPQDLEYTLTQDIPSLKSTWSIFYFNCWSEHYYRLEQTQSRRAIPPFLEAWWEYKPGNGWSFHAEVDNFVPFTYANQFDDYNGPRNTFPVALVDDRRITSQPRVFFQIRKTFD
ncbi:MAG TPA: TonB-dependent receptor [Rhizomicrobium sp.]|nr:TonB-dependent receptor [Rhizomicrobium sp.]